ncbi:MAG: class I SAM-dependent methyltransferase [Puniceicoccaceae bacterium]
MNQHPSFLLHAWLRPHAFVSSHASLQNTADIHPEDLIQSEGVDGLCRTAEEYYRQIRHPDWLLRKPFGDAETASHVLPRLGFVLQGLRLRKGDTVLDFGAGTCWLGKILHTMGCRVICLDPSETALELGRQVVGYEAMSEADRERMQFLHFDGHRIELPDESVDRILCFDALHHVPNLESILSEFARITQAGAVVALNEPVGRHSCTAASQHEMRKYRVLENDLDLNSICDRMRKLGFTPPHFRFYPSDDVFLTYRERRCLLGRGIWGKLKLCRRLFRNLTQTMRNEAVCFFEKPGAIMDSRSTRGLAGKISWVQKPELANWHGHQPVKAVIELQNTGQAHWLFENAEDHGVVKLGCWVVDGEGDGHERVLLTRKIPHAMEPGARTVLEVELENLPLGFRSLRFDLLATHVIWMSQLGCSSLHMEAEPAAEHP